MSCHTVAGRQGTQPVPSELAATGIFFLIYFCRSATPESSRFSCCCGDSDMSSEDCAGAVVADSRQSRRDFPPLEPSYQHHPSQHTHLLFPRRAEIPSNPYWKVPLGDAFHQGWRTSRRENHPFTVKSLTLPFLTFCPPGTNKEATTQKSASYPCWLSQISELCTHLRACTAEGVVGSGVAKRVGGTRQGKIWPGGGGVGGQDIQLWNTKPRLRCRSIHAGCASAAHRLGRQQNKDWTLRMLTLKG